MLFKLHPPVIITSRLLAGVKVGNTEISIQYDSITSEGRMVYRYYIDNDILEYENNDIKSGCQGGNMQKGLSCLLSMLCAAAEAYNYGPKSDNYDMFPPNIMEWCDTNSDELSMLCCELEENPKLIEEE